ncbi:MAG: CobW family GTP-binding protein [Candidatus Heteroscillospira sp.]|jgi:G3E family GTPase
MTKIDIVSGFLGAGKTTLIKKLLAEVFKGEKLVLIENEFGEISIDGGFLKDSGVQISEMSSGCICCSLVGDFGKALKEVQDTYKPDRILIEPSGVGKLSDVITAVKNTIADNPDMRLNSAVTVCDATKAKIYMKNFGEFYNNQVESSGAIILSRTQKLSQEKLESAVALLREKNPGAAILTTPWDELPGSVILFAMEHKSLADQLMAEVHHEHECADPNCSCHEHHHEHHHHEHECDDPNCSCHDHEHEHHHHDHECDDPNCSCHDHEHHHHHHADEVFTSWGRETPRLFTRDKLDHILSELDSGAYGKILRAKGIVPDGTGWLEFDYVPEEYEVRPGAPDYTGRLCVIGSQLREDKLTELFGL